MRKIFLKLHLWLSFPIGLIITIICLSGAVLVFQEEINEALYHDRYFVKEKKGEALPLNELLDKVNNNLENNSIRSVQIPSNPSKNYIMSLKEGNFVSICVDPYTGEVTGQIERGKSFTGWVMRLHRWLLDNNRTIGKNIVGYTTLLFAIILITGIPIWWPKTMKQLKSRMKVETKYGWKRFWLDMHTTAGMYVCLVLLALALTGLTYSSIPWYNKGFYKILGIDSSTRAHDKPNAQQGGKEKAQPAEGRNPMKAKGENNLTAENASHRGKPNGTRPEGGEIPRHGNNRELPSSTDSIAAGKTNNNTFKGSDNEPKKDKPINTQHWNKVVAELKAKNPDFKVISVQDGSVSVSHNTTFGNARASDKYTFEPESGEILTSTLYKDQPRSNKVRGWVYSIHVGAWGGMFSKILTSFIAIIGASLPITGYYMFYVKRKRYKKK